MTADGELAVIPRPSDCRLHHYPSQPRDASIASGFHNPVVDLVHAACLKLGRRIRRPKHHDPPQPLDRIHGIPSGKQGTSGEAVLGRQKAVIQLERNHALGLPALVERDNL